MSIDQYLTTEAPGLNYGSPPSRTGVFLAAARIERVLIPTVLHSILDSYDEYCWFIDFARDLIGNRDQPFVWNPNDGIPSTSIMTLAFRIKRGPRTTRDQRRDIKWPTVAGKPCQRSAKCSILL